MAIDPSVEYPGQIDTTTDPTGYPLGQPQNVSAPSSGDGTPLEKAWLADVFGFLQALLDEDGASPSGTPDKVGASQYLTAIKNLVDNATGIGGKGSSALSTTSATPSAIVKEPGKRLVIDFNLDSGGSTAGIIIDPDNTYNGSGSVGTAGGVDGSTSGTVGGSYSDVLGLSSFDVEMRLQGSTYQFYLSSVASANYKYYWI